MKCVTICFGARMITKHAECITQQPLVSFKHDNNLRNILAKSSLNLIWGQTKYFCILAPDSTLLITVTTLSLSWNAKYKRLIVSIVGVKIYSTLWKMKYIGDTGKRLEDRFHEQLCVVNTTWENLTTESSLNPSLRKIPRFFVVFRFIKAEMKVTYIFQIGSFTLLGIQEIISLNDIILAFSGIMFHLIT